jgi:two-component system chemotaxis sensor kinase CheA
MAEVHHEAGGSGADFDLSQFYQIFFEEAGENLDLMEQMLLNLNLQTADDEELNGVFRCAHSVKGGAATFGFSDVAELTHQMESLLDRLRRHELQPTSVMVDVLLESADASRSLLARHQAGGEGTALPTADLVKRIRAIVAGEAATAVVKAPAPSAAPAMVEAPPPAAVVPVALETPVERAVSSGHRRLNISISKLVHAEEANAIQELFRDIPGLGQITSLPCSDASRREFFVETTSTNDDLLDLFAFHVSREQVAIQEEADEVMVAPVVTPAPVSAATAVPTGAEAGGFGFFDGAPGAPGTRASARGARRCPPWWRRPPVAVGAGQGRNRLRAASAAQPEAATIRVAISKVDQLINLVGELVITQAMLAQNSRGLDPALYQQLLTGLTDLDRNTRDLQESVMSIRMIPMSIVVQPLSPDAA